MKLVISKIVDASRIILKASILSIIVCAKDDFHFEVRLRQSGSVSRTINNNFGENLVK